MSNESKGIKDDLRRLKRAVLLIVSDVWFLNTVSQSCFVIGLGGVGGIGVIFAIPYLYENYSDNVIFYVRLFGCFLAMQMIVNWLCIKFVDTSYNPYRDGTIPDGVSMGVNISRLGCADENQNSGILNNHGRKDATAIDMGNNGSLMYVASEMPKSPEQGPKRTAYPYFSWTPCLRCNRPRPPRCHHCPMCNTCVLKRDHHCFVSGACIGYRNMRHFTVFLFWAAVATTFATVHACPYYYYDVLPYTSYFDFIFPIAVTRAMFGYIDMKHAVFIVLGWILLAFLLWAISFLQVVADLIKSGKTTFETEYKMELYDSRGIFGKLRAVFGNYWILNFIIPLHFVFEPVDDPVKWPYIKA